MNIPWCSIIALLKIGLSHSLHFTTPFSGLNGSDPKVFISFAESHSVGGDDGSWGWGDSDGDVGKLSHENEADGDDILYCFNFKAIV